MRRLKLVKLFLILLLIFSVIGMTAFASDVSLTVNNNIVNVHNAPKDSTLYTVAYKDGKIVNVSMVTGEVTMNVDSTTVHQSEKHTINL